MSEDSTEATRSRLREEITEALNAESVDYDLVLRLSAELASLDPRYVRFTVDAGHISRLGRELVSRQETAVAELVKNAYDADASSVTLVFSDVERRGGSLEIIDDGNGMTRDDLVRGFMRLSSTMKVHAPRSPRYSRQRAGKKGIGRFAAQRLGEVLTITTQVADSPTALRVQINWEDFAADRELASVRSAIVEVPKDRASGTTLLIERLRESWTPALVRKSYRHVIDLIQPFPLSDAAAHTPQQSDPGFTVTFKRRSVDGESVVADEQQMLLDNALAIVNGRVDVQGRGFWSVISGRLHIRDVDQPIGPDRESPEQPFRTLRDIRFRAHYFINEAGYLPRQTASAIRAALRAHGGIRVYRNGFRVLPYGEPGDDWLGLDQSYRQRLLLVPHGNDNFFGIVELFDPAGDRFEETSSREGLLNNDAFEELVDFTSRAIKAAVTRVNEARGVKITSGQRDWTRRIVSPADKVRDVAQGLNAVANRLDIAAVVAGGTDDSSDLPADDLRELAANLNQAAEEQEQESKSLLEELGMLRVLASLGLTIGEFTHEIRQYLPAIQADTEYFAQLHAKEPEAGEVANRLRANFAAFRTYAAYFDAAISDNATRQLRAQEVRDVVNAFVKTVQPALARAAITLEPPQFVGYQLYVRPMHASEWASILFNFFTNARKAIARRGVAGRISIHAGRNAEKKSIYLEFADNGDGVPVANVDRIFHAFFTTSAPARRLSADHEDVVGTGLGLKIVRDIVTAYGGTVELVSPPSGFATCFRVDIPEAAPGEVADGDY